MQGFGCITQRDRLKLASVILQRVYRAESRELPERLQELLRLLQDKTARPERGASA